MARRNRKKQKVNGFLMPAPVASVVVMLSVLALAYIWLGTRCESVGKAIKVLESEQIILKQELSNQRGKWAEMKSPRNLALALAKHGIHMTLPKGKQIVEIRGKFYEGWRDTFDDSPKYARLERSRMHE